MTSRAGALGSVRGVGAGRVRNGSSRGGAGLRAGDADGGRGRVAPYLAKFTSAASSSEFFADAPLE